jgi:hypothetical protein
VGHIEFYRNAEKREKAFLRNMLQLIKWKLPAQNSQLGTILVAGGFHTEGLTKRFKEAGISYLLVTPQMTSVPEQTNYRAHMQGDVSWKDYFRVENGKVNLYKAFVRGTRDRLLRMKSSEFGVSSFEVSINSQRRTPNSKLLLKAWRDQIIRDLAEKGQITKAHEYAQFIDEIAQDPGFKFQGFKPHWQIKLEEFIKKLRRLDSEGRLTEQNILQLLTPANSIPDGFTSPGGTIRPGASLPDSFFKRDLAPTFSRAEVRIPPFQPKPGPVEGFPEIDTSDKALQSHQIQRSEMRAASDGKSWKKIFSSRWGKTGLTLSLLALGAAGVAYWLLPSKEEKLPSMGITIEEVDPFSWADKLMVFDHDDRHRALAAFQNEVKAGRVLPAMQRQIIDILFQSFQKAVEAGGPDNLHHAQHIAGALIWEEGALAKHTEMRAIILSKFSEILGKSSSRPMRINAIILLSYPAFEEETRSLELIVNAFWDKDQEVVQRAVGALEDRKDSTLALIPLARFRIHPNPDIRQDAENVAKGILAPIADNPAFFPPQYSKRFIESARSENLSGRMAGAEILRIVASHQDPNALKPILTMRTSFMLHRQSL